MTSQRIIIDRRAAPLVLRDLAVPMPGTGELLVRVEATGIAFADLLMRAGLYPATGFPVTPGYEVVGRVESGAGFAVGTRVAALTVTGGYARHAVIPAATAVVVPDALSSAQAAALVLNGLTALQMLTRANALAATRSMLVWGAAGGVGSLLIELGRHFGIESFGVASGSRLAAVTAAGGVAIDRANGDVAGQLRALRPGGVDVVFDGVGGSATRTSLAAIRSGGQVVMYGIQGGAPGGRRSLPDLLRLLASMPRPSPLALFSKGHGLRGYLVTDWRDFHREDLATLFEFAVAGKITPQIARELPLERAAEAQALLASGTAQGKIILTC